MTRFGFTLMTEQSGPRRLVEQSVRAEALGFDFEVMSDHYFPWLAAQGHAPYAWSVLGAVAQAAAPLLEALRDAAPRGTMTPEGPVTVHGSEEVHALTGLTLGPSAWFQVDQERDDRFARAVEDWHWAHNEPERAARAVRWPDRARAPHPVVDSHLFRRLLVFTDGECMFHGYDRVSFPQAAPLGSRLRISGEVSAATAITGGEQLAVDLRIDADGAERPACVAQPVWRLYHLGAVS